MRTEQSAGGCLTAAPGVRKANKASRCIDCVNGGGRCPWSRSLEPVPGWTVEKVILRTQSNGKGRHEEIYKVIDCPGYSPRRNRGNWKMKH